MYIDDKEYIAEEDILKTTKRSNAELTRNVSAVIIYSNSIKYPYSPAGRLWREAICSSIGGDINNITLGC